MKQTAAEFGRNQDGNGLEFEDLDCFLCNSEQKGNDIRSKVKSETMWHTHAHEHTAAKKNPSDKVNHEPSKFWLTHSLSRKSGRQNSLSTINFKKDKRVQSRMRRSATHDKIAYYGEAADGKMHKQNPQRNKYSQNGKGQAYNSGSTEKVPLNETLPLPSKTRLTCTLFIQMQYFAASDLRKWMNDRSIRTKRMCVQVRGGEEHSIFVQICEGLRWIHSKGLIHQDLKPENIFIENDRVFIADFGLSVQENGTAIVHNTVESSDDEYFGVSHHWAKSLRNKVDKNNKLSTNPELANAFGSLNMSDTAGTYIYSSPEQYMSRRMEQSCSQTTPNCCRANKEVTFRLSTKSDVFSLGIILYELFQAIPFVTRMERAIKICELRKCGIVQDIEMRDSHGRIVEVVEWMLHHDPHDRPSIEHLMNSNQWNELQNQYNTEFSLDDLPRSKPKNWDQQHPSANWPTRCTSLGNVSSELSLNISPTQNSSQYKIFQPLQYEIDELSSSTLKSSHTSDDNSTLYKERRLRRWSLNDVLYSAKVSH